jgi:hypothetical protein
LATGALESDGACVLASVLDGFWQATASAKAHSPMTERGMELPNVEQDCVSKRAILDDNRLKGQCISKRAANAAAAPVAALGS